MSSRYPGKPCCNEGEHWWNRKHVGVYFICSCCRLGYCRQCSINGHGGFVDTCRNCNGDMCALCVGGKCAECDDIICVICCSDSFHCSVESCECFSCGGWHDEPKCVECAEYVCSKHRRLCDICGDYHCTNCDDSDLDINMVTCRFCGKHPVTVRFTTMFF